MNSKHHKSDVFLIAIQLFVVTRREIYMRTQTVSAKRLNIERWHVFNFCGYYYVQTTNSALESIYMYVCITYKLYNTLFKETKTLKNHNLKFHVPTIFRWIMLQLFIHIILKRFYQSKRSTLENNLIIQINRSNLS